MAVGKLMRHEPCKPNIPLLIPRCCARVSVPGEERTEEGTGQGQKGLPEPRVPYS